MLESKTTVTGHLGNDVYVNEEKKFFSFSVAAVKSDQTKPTQWVEFSRSYKEDLPGYVPYLKKGTLVYVEGTPYARLVERVPEGKKKAEVTAVLAHFANKIELLSGKQKTEE